MNLTPEQRTAQDALHRAIVEHVKAFRPDGEIPEMVTDWMVIGCVNSYDGDGDKLVSYNVAFSDVSMDDHRAMGLCRIGEKIVSGEWEMA